MKTPAILFLFVSLLFINTTAHAVVSVAEKAPANAVAPAMTKSDMEATLGRKVKLNEWLTYKIFTEKAAKKKIKAHGERDGSGFAVAGLVLGILSITTLNLLFAILGIVFSATALMRMRKNGFSESKGMAKAGLITAIIGGVLAMGLIGILIFSMI